LAATALAAATTGPASAEDGGWTMNGIFPAWSDADSGNSFAFRGRVYIDAADIEYDSAGVETGYSDREFRTARLGVTGSVSGVDYVAEFDFAGGGVSANDVNLGFDLGAADLKIGYIKTPNSLDEQTSSRYTTFMERGIGTDLFGIDRRVGAILSHGSERYSLAAGVFGGRLGDLSETTELDDSSALAARATWAPVAGEDLTVHLGASVRHLDYGGAGTRVRVRPQAHIPPRVVTADFRPSSMLGEADSSAFFGLEAALIRGPVHAQAEWMRLDVDGPAGDPDFTSSYASLGWFVTGETRSYSASSGKFGRTRPQQTLTEGGPGAIELAVRYDRSDLDSVGAGVLTNWTAGVNWYLEDHVRIMANYITGTLDVAGGADIDVSGPQLRLQWDF
jgi:phosphate-selective porin OprO/OprP